MLKKSERRSNKSSYWFIGSSGRTGGRTGRHDKYIKIRNIIHPHTHYTFFSTKYYKLFKKYIKKHKGKLVFFLHKHLLNVE